jgi:uncharacterized membrane protein
MYSDKSGQPRLVMARNCGFGLALLAGSGFFHAVHPSGFTYTAVDAPGAIATLPFDVNNLGQIVGATTFLPPSPDGGGTSESFVLSSGQYTLFGLPFSTYSEAHAINNFGSIVGEFRDGTKPLSENIFHGYIANALGIASLDMPGSSRTFGNGINDSGEIVGGYQDSAGSIFGFIDNGGAFTTISLGDGSFTEVSSVNNLRDIAGFYHDNRGFHGFLERDGQISTLDVPGANYTNAAGLNDLGDVVGDYFLPSDSPGAASIRHGFLYDGTTYTEIAVPGFEDSTFARGINDAGVIVGGYQVASNTQGFVATPVPVPAPGIGFGLQAFLAVGGMFTGVKLWRIARSDRT